MYEEHQQNQFQNPNMNGGFQNQGQWQPQSHPQFQGQPQFQNQGQFQGNPFSNCNNEFANNNPFGQQSGFNYQNNGQFQGQQQNQWCPTGQQANAFSQPQTAPQNQPQQQERLPQNNVGQNEVKILTREQVIQLMETLKATPISNPVKIDKPAYIVTEEQMKYLMSLANGNDTYQMAKDAVFGQPQLNSIPFPLPLERTHTNTLDTLGEMTLGTVSKIGHGFTELVNSVVDVITLGYGKK